MGKHGKKRTLHSLAAPKTWFFNRKSKHYTSNIVPGPHSKGTAVPLVFLLRDLLGMAKTLKDVKRLTHNKEIFVNGSLAKEARFPVGLMDVVSLPKIKKNFRVILDRKGRLYPIEITEKEASMKLVKIMDKTAISKSKIQLNLHDGTTILADKKYSTKDTLLIKIPEKKILKVLAFKKGALVLIIKGKHAGATAVIDSIKEEEGKVILKEGKDKFETPRNYVFIIGEDKPEIKVTE